MIMYLNVASIVDSLSLSLLVHLQELLADVQQRKDAEQMRARARGCNYWVVVLFDAHLLFPIIRLLFPRIVRTSYNRQRPVNLTDFLA